MTDRYRFAWDEVITQRCAFGDDARGYCGERAEIHVLVKGDEHTMACTIHKAWFDTHSFEDQHPVVGACALPNTDWVYSNDDGHGWCEVVGFPDLAVEWGVRHEDSERVETCSEATAAILAGPGVTAVSHLVGPWTPATPNPPEVTP